MVSKINVNEHGMYRVKLFDTAYPVDTGTIVVNFTTKAIANSIARHGNKEIRKMERELGHAIDMWYHVDNIEDLEPRLDYWR